MDRPTNDAADIITVALTGITRHHGEAIWADPGRLRSRLQYVVGAVDESEAGLIDAVVLAASYGVPGALRQGDELPEITQRLSESLGPVTASRAVALWARAIAEFYTGPLSTTESAPAGSAQAEPEAAPHDPRAPIPMPPDEPSPAELAAVGAAAPSAAAVAPLALAEAAPAAPARAVAHRREPKIPESDPPEVPPRTEAAIEDALAANRRNGAGHADRRRRRARRWWLLVGLVVIAAFAVAAIVGSGRGARDAQAPETAPPSTVPPPETSAPVVTAPPATTPPPTTAPTRGGEFVWLAAPVRLLDTRSTGPVTTATARVAGVAAIPAEARAAIVYLALENVTGSGTAVIAPAGATSANVAQVPYVAGRPASATVLVPLSDDGRIDVRLNSSPANVLVSAVAYVASDAAPGGLSLRPEPSPRSLFDGTVDGGAAIDLQLGSGAAGALLSVRATAAGEPGPLSFSAAASPDERSPLVVVERAESAVLLYTLADAQGRVRMLNSTRGPVRVNVSVVALFAAGPRPADAYRLSATAPLRAATASCSNAPGAGLTGIARAFPTARALALAITVTDAAAGGQLAVAGQRFDYTAGAARTISVLAPVTNDQIALSCSAGRPSVVVDVLAVFE